MLCEEKDTTMPALHPLFLLSFETCEKYTLFHLKCNEMAFPLFSSPLTLSKSHLETPHLKPSLFSLVHRLPLTFDAYWLQVVFHRLNNNLFESKIYLRHEANKQTVITEFDIKPSDALLLSLTEKLDLYCTDSLFQTLETTYAELSSSH